MLKGFMKQMIEAMAFEDLLKLAGKANGKSSCIVLNDFIGDREEAKAIAERVLREVEIEIDSIDGRALVDGLMVELG